MVIMKTLDNLKYLNKGLAIFSWIVFMIENLILLKFVDIARSVCKIYKFHYRVFLQLC